MPKLIFWYEFASPYAYLSATQIEKYAQRHGVDVIWRPFLLGPIFQSQGWSDSPFNIYEAKGLYLWQDTNREAAKLGLPPIKRPDPFPQHSLLAARIATIGVSEGWAPSFSKAIYSAEFVDGKPIGNPDTLIRLLDDQGLDGVNLVKRAQTDQSVKDTLRRTNEEAVGLNIFGAPSFMTEDGTLFWGNDRMEDAIHWAIGAFPGQSDL